MNLTVLGSFIGGVGLFLLGMKLMTDGLKLAAGQALRRILGEWTRTPVRGLLSGILITSLVQSSSAVTVATIGFVNAGLLTLFQSIGVIYGSNIGTTMTGWLVALVGFKVDVKVLALPLIGLGMVLSLTGRGSRRGPLGEALTGFGLFFLGVDILKTTFEGIGATMPLEQLGGDSLLAPVLFVGIGFVLTFLMQSSSAAMALILTATAGGVVPLAAAAAAVIGANVGTTSTAILSVLGATANAQRVAAAHVLFNLLAGVVALLVLPLMLLAVDYGREVLDMAESPAVALALFHTLFNILGVALMWPLTPRMVGLLERRYRTAEEDAGRPQYLDKNILGTPDLAMDAVALELARIGAIARNMAIGALSTEKVAGRQIEIDKASVHNLVEAVSKFSVGMQRGHLPREFDESLPNGLRVSRYFTAVAELAHEVATAQGELAYLEDETLAEQISRFKGEAVQLMKAADPRLDDYDPERCEASLAALEESYQRLKAQMLRAGADERIRTSQMVAQLELFSRIRRMLEQAVKGGRYLHGLLRLVASFQRRREEAEKLESETASEAPDKEPEREDGGEP